MTCRRCRKKIEEFETRCPHCGDVNEKASGMFQTSTVLIFDQRHGPGLPFGG